MYLLSLTIITGGILLYRKYYKYESKVRKNKEFERYNEYMLEETIYNTRIIEVPE